MKKQILIGIFPLLIGDYANASLLVSLDEWSFAFGAVDLRVSNLRFYVDSSVGGYDVNWSSTRDYSEYGNDQFDVRWQNAISQVSFDFSAYNYSDEHELLRSGSYEISPSNSILSHPMSYDGKSYLTINFADNSQAFINGSNLSYLNFEWEGSPTPIDENGGSVFKGQSAGPFVLSADSFNSSGLSFEMNFSKGLTNYYFGDGGFLSNESFTVTEVPIPSTWILMSSALMGASRLVRRKNPAPKDCKATMS